MSDNIPIKFGISHEFPCNYIDGQQERLLVAIDPIIQTPNNYQQLLTLGFRRSGPQVYRPHCQNCVACQSIRIPVLEFSASKSQKRTLKKCAEFTIHLNLKQNDLLRYYPVYESYINNRHADGSMYPASVEQYQGFIAIDWLTVGFLEISINNKLIGVCVVDCLPDSYSAVYTFFDPEYEAYSIGRFAILQLIELARLSKRKYVYLGYQVDECRKMNYKTQYFPHQRLIAGHWQEIKKE